MTHLLIALAILAACPQCHGTRVRLRLAARLVSAGVAAGIRQIRQRRESER